jgi:hypothetical protein
MHGTIVVTDPRNGEGITLCMAEIDHGGNIIDQGILDALKRGGCSWHVVRDLGLGYMRFNEARGGWGWGGRPHGIE